MGVVADRLAGRWCREVVRVRVVVAAFIVAHRVAGRSGEGCNIRRAAAAAAPAEREATGGEGIANYLESRFRRHNGREAARGPKR